MQSHSWERRGQILEALGGCDLLLFGGLLKCTLFVLMYVPALLSCSLSSMPSFRKDTQSILQLLSQMFLFKMNRTVSGGRKQTLCFYGLLFDSKSTPCWGSKRKIKRYYHIISFWCFLVMLRCNYISNSEWCGIHLKEFSEGNCWQSDLWREWLGICGQLHMESEFQCLESSWLATSNDTRSFGFHISLALASKGCSLLSCEVLTKVSSGDSTAWPCVYDTCRHDSGPFNSYWSLLGYLLEVEKCHWLNLRKDKLESTDRENSEKRNSRVHRHSPHPSDLVCDFKLVLNGNQFMTWSFL